MHNVKENMKQLLMPWKRKLAESDEQEDLQSNDDFGTHPGLQVKQLCCCYTAFLACHSQACQNDSVFVHQLSSSPATTFHLGHAIAACYVACKLTRACDAAGSARHEACCTRPAGAHEHGRCLAP